MRTSCSCASFSTLRSGALLCASNSHCMWITPHPLHGVHFARVQPYLPTWRPRACSALRWVQPQSETCAPTGKHHKFHHKQHACVVGVKICLTWEIPARRDFREHLPRAVSHKARITKGEEDTKHSLVKCEHYVGGGTGGANAPFHAHTSPCPVTSFTRQSLPSVNGGGGRALGRFRR